MDPWLGPAVLRDGPATVVTDLRWGDTRRLAAAGMQRAATQCRRYGLATIFYRRRHAAGDMLAVISWTDALPPTDPVEPLAANYAALPLEAGSAGHCRRPVADAPQAALPDLLTRMVGPGSCRWRALTGFGATALAAVLGVDEVALRRRARTGAEADVDSRGVRRPKIQEASRKAGIRTVGPFPDRFVARCTGSYRLQGQ